MDGRAAQDAPDACRIADRRCLCACIAVLDADSSRTVLEDPELSFAVAAAVSTVRRLESGSVFAAVGSVGGRGRNAFDAAARWQRLCRRHHDRNCAASRGAAFGICGAIASECASETVDRSAESLAAHRGRDPAFQTYLPPGCADRQREPFERADYRASRAADRPGGRSPAAAGSVYKALGERRSVRRTPGIRHVARVRIRIGGLYLRAVADAHRKSAGNSAGNPFAV